MSAKESLSELTNAFELNYRLKNSIAAEEARIKYGQMMSDVQQRGAALERILEQLSAQFLRLSMCRLSLTKCVEGPVSICFRGYANGSPLLSRRISVSMHRGDYAALVYQLEYEDAEVSAVTCGPLRNKLVFQSEAKFCVALANVIGAYLAYYTPEPTPEVKPKKKSAKRTK